MLFYAIVKICNAIPTPFWAIAKICNAIPIPFYAIVEIRNAIPTPSQEWFIIYPNPTTGNIQLEWPSASTGTSSVKLINTLGQLVFNRQTSMNKGIGTLSVSGLSKGMYMLKVEFDKQVLTSRLIVSE
jgi:hypothetical protein